MKVIDQLNRKISVLVLEYQKKFPENVWDTHQMLQFIKKKDAALARQKDKNIQNGIYIGKFHTIKELQQTQIQNSDSEEENEDVQMMEVVNSNAMNNSLLDVYSNTKEDAKKEIVTKKRVRVSSAQSIKKQKFSAEPSLSQKLSDLGGIDDCIEKVLELIGMPLKHPEIYTRLGTSPPMGILLHGPAGCGKTSLAHAIASEVDVPFFSVSAPSIVSGMSGESEKKLRQVFEEAQESAPCLLFIDEIDAITPKRENAQREMERRIVAQLLTCMDDCSRNNKLVIVIGATNRPDSLDPALRRPGRFDREITMGVPDEVGRQRILEKLAEKLTLAGDFDFKALAKLTPGYVGADLKALTNEAGMIAVKRIFLSIRSEEANQVSANKGVITSFLESRTEPLNESELEALFVTNDDFLGALDIVQPSSKREGFATVPDVTWDDIGALSSVRDELRMAIVEPIKNPEKFASVGITQSCGVLLYGPPGCGKTLLAKAVSNETMCNFLSVKGPELLNKYVGESERAIRQVFARARASRPCIIFFDELDALCPSRTGESESQHSSRLVNTLLAEMDGMGGRKQVYVIAATNRPDMIDPAMLRGGRLDKALYVDFPNADERREILKTLCKSTPLSSSVCLKTIAVDPRCDGFSGADLKSLVREAAVSALRRHTESSNVLVEAVDFESAHSRMSGSVSSKDRKRYELLKTKFGRGF